MAGVNPAMVIRVAANISELRANLAEGKNLIDTTTAAMSKLASSLDGSRLEQRAHNIVAAINSIGGATKLTDAEATRHLRTLDAWVQKADRMGKTVPTDILATRDALQKVNATAEQAPALLDKINARAVALGAAMGTFLGQMAWMAVRQLGSALMEFVAQGAKLPAVEQSFQKLAKGLGSDSAAMIATMKTATQGLVSNYDLMLSANKAMLLGLPVTAASMADLSKAATTLGKAMGLDATQALDNLITALGRSSPLILDNLGLTVKVGQANEAYAATLGTTASALTDAQKKIAFYEAAMEAARAKTEEIGEQTKTLGEIITSVWTSIGNAVSSTASDMNITLGAALSSASGFATFLQDMATGGYAFAVAAANARTHMDDLAKAVTAARIKAVADMAAITAAMQTMAKDAATHAASYLKHINEDIAVGTESAAKKAAAALDKFRASIRDLSTVTHTWAGHMTGLSTITIPAVISQMDALDQAVLKVTRDFTDLNGTIGLMPNVIGEMPPALDEVTVSAEEMGDTGATAALAMAVQFINIAQQAIAAAKAIDSVTNSASQSVNALSGAAKGAEVGGQIGGPWGALFGAIAGGIAGLIKSLNNSATQAKEILRDFDVSVSAGLAKTINDTAKSTYYGFDQMGNTVERYVGRADAALRHLSEIISEAGGVSVDRLDFWTKKTRDLFSAIERGTMTVGMVAEQLNDIFPQLAAHIDRTGGIASRQLLEIIALADRFGVVSQGISDFISQQAGAAGGGLNAILGGMQGSATAVEQAHFDSLIAASKAMLDQVSGAEREALQTKIAAYEQARDAIVGTFIQSEQQARGLGAAVVGTFAVMIANGASLREALTAINPSIDILREQLALTGIDGGAAFNGLAILAAAAADPIAGPLFDAIAGVDSALKGLHNSGILNQEMFTGLALTATQAYDQLIAQGVDGNAAMMAMQPTLQTIWQLQRDFGYEVDESTQKLIDQAVEAGTVGDRFRDASDRIARSMDRVVIVLEAIARGMGFDFPEAAGEAQTAGETAMGATEQATDLAAGAVNELTASIGRTISEMGNLDTKPFDDITAAAKRAAAAVDTLNFGHSPGGLKEIPILLNEAERAARSFERTMTIVADTVYGAVDGMSGEVEKLLKELGLMYAFAAGFDDFLAGDEKRLKEAGLYDLWRQIGMGGAGNRGGGGGDGETYRPMSSGGGGGMTQVIEFHMGDEVVARHAAKGMQSRVRLYAR